MQEEDSLKKRYVFKILTNLIGFPLGLLSQSIIPRALGPAAYGNFSFLTDFFAQVISFFDAGTSIGFYVKLSQRQKEHELLKFYWSFVLLVALLLALLIIGVMLAGRQELFWPEQQIKFVWMGMVFALLGWFTTLTLKVVDAHGLTKQGEIARLAQRILGFLLLALMYFYYERFSLTQFFIYHYVTIFILIIFWWWVLARIGISLFPAIRLPFEVFKKYVVEFYHYTAPLVIYSVVSLATGLLDKWFLQKFSGSIEQGFFGLSYQIGAVCFVFTMSMTPLITREFSIAFGKKDSERMRYLFQRFIPMLYAVAAYLSVFILFQANNVAFLMGGEGFKGSALAVAIMALYPLHQTYGQLSGSMFYATGQTRLYRNIGVTMMLLSLPVTYFVLAPEHMLGLNAGAPGLAVKMVLMQFLIVNVQLWFNTRYLHLSFLKFFAHQFYSLLALGIPAFAASYLVSGVVQDALPAFVLSGLIYSLIVAGMLFLIPSIFSISREELTGLMENLKARFPGK